MQIAVKQARYPVTGLSAKIPGVFGTVVGIPDFRENGFWILKNPPRPFEPYPIEITMVSAVYPGCHAKEAITNAMRGKYDTLLDGENQFVCVTPEPTAAPTPEPSAKMA